MPNCMLASASMPFASSRHAVSRLASDFPLKNDMNGDEVSKLASSPRSVRAIALTDIANTEIAAAKPWLAPLK